MLANKVVQTFGLRVPRYTSYPTVPQWSNMVTTDPHSDQNWSVLVSDYITGLTQPVSIALYIHLPFCESLCTYCGCNKRITRNHTFEAPYIQTLLQEWSNYLALPGFRDKIKVSRLHLGGGTPTFFAPENLSNLIDGLKASGLFLEDCSLSFEGHPSSTTALHLQRLAEHGFNRLSLGIQDFGEKVQFLINRKQTVEEVKNVVLQARRNGYESINFDIVYGLPGQTENSLLETLQHTIDLEPDRIAYYSYAHVPWMYKGQRRYNESDIPDIPLRNKMLEAGIDFFTASGYAYIGMDHFARPSDKLYEAFRNHRMFRDFMGYSDTVTDGTIGLGCSSISDFANAYAQNDKTVESYRKKIDLHGFAVSKGHKLSKRENTTRRIIQDIMCNVPLSLNDLPVCDQVRYRKREADLKQLGLISESEGFLSVTGLGTRYLRSIASVFDPYYSVGSEHQYSKAL